jgi:hypothetical protein
MGSIMLISIIPAQSTRRRRLMIHPSPEHYYLSTTGIVCLHCESRMQVTLGMLAPGLAQFSVHARRTEG